MTTGTALDRLRAQARLTTLFPSTTLADAVHRLGFVQADPIRAPARAQDLILRHRVNRYRVGDLERSFARLGLEEDFLYAYGFMPGETRYLLHPRIDPANETGVHVPDGLAADVLAFARTRGATHPRDLKEHFGRVRAVNGWGGFSKATTQALESLRHYGLRAWQNGARAFASTPWHLRCNQRSTAVNGCDSWSRQPAIEFTLDQLGALAPTHGGTSADRCAITVRSARIFSTI